MSKFIKRLCVILAVLMVLPLLVACGSGSSKSDNEGGGEYDIIDKVGEDVDYDGATFTILCREDNAWGEYLHEISADENETDVVNQAVYNRNLQLEERINVDLDIYAIAGQWAVKDDFINTFRNSILAGDGAFDLIMSQQAYMCELGLNELYVNYNEVPYIKDDLDAEYFYQDLVNELTVNNKLYYMVGDYSLTLWEYLYVLFFNKKIAENENIEDIYQLVRDGSWTVDKMIELAKGLYRDLDGSGYANEDGDQYGYISDIVNTTDAWYSQFDCQPTSKDADGNVVISIDQGKMVSILEKMNAFFQTEDVYSYYTNSSMTADEPEFDNIFTEDRALFYDATLSNAQKYRGMETDFGIVPYPKWDESQADYYTQAQNGYSVAVIPIDVKNVEMSGAALDILSATSYQLVIPAYYDVSLKNKYSRDEDSSEMLDIIREGIKVNFGYFYYAPLGMGGIIRQMVKENNSNFVSYYASNSKGYQRNLNKILATYEDSSED